MLKSHLGQPLIATSKNRSMVNRAISRDQEQQYNSQPGLSLFQLCCKNGKCLPVNNILNIFIKNMSCISMKPPTSIL